MRARITQVLLGTIVGLLAANVLRPAAVRADETRTDETRVADVLRARLIELVDDKGQPRASLRVEPGGEAVFRMLGANGEIRVKLGASDDGSGLLLLDPQSEPAIHLVAKPDRTTLTLAQKGKEKRVLRP